MTIKTFTLGEVLSVTLRKMMVLDHEKMYTVVRHMLGRPIFTHELLAAFAVCTPHILSLPCSIVTISTAATSARGCQKSWSDSATRSSCLNSPRDRSTAIRSMGRTSLW
jgi:hypothetical protein